jgi:hypothetical protein
MKPAIFSVLFWLSMLSVAYGHGGDNQPQGRLQELLRGSWEHLANASDLPEAAREENAAPEESLTAYVRYELRENGVFVCSLTHGQTRREDIGRWEIAPDGLHLLISFPFRETQKALIRYIELDEMVLESDYILPGCSGLGVQRQMFFNKL